MSRVILFAKRPRPGLVKTRLTPPFEPAEAAALYRAFLVDRLNQLRRDAARLRPEVWWDARPTEDDRAGLPLEGLVERVQPRGDLGARLRRAFDAAPGPALAIGADSPTLCGADLQRAFAALDAATPVALQPALDGGYVLLGLARPLPALLREIPWSGPDVCATTLRRAESLGVPVALLPEGFDVDDADGLRLLDAALADPAVAAACPATQRVLRLLLRRSAP